jgi:large subunit ribosomal protein L10e
VIREHAIAQGAGADRFSQWMRRNFGHPQTTAVQVKKDQRILMLKVNKANLETAKQALKKASLKLPTPLRLEIQQ